jgi:hypothetical protein
MKPEQADCLLSDWMRTTMLMMTILMTLQQQKIDSNIQMVTNAWKFFGNIPNLLG